MTPPNGSDFQIPDIRIEFSQNENVGLDLDKKDNVNNLFVYIGHYGNGAS